jgi:hypothetical protein
VRSGEIGATKGERYDFSIRAISTPVIKDESFKYFIIVRLGRRVFLEPSCYALTPPANVLDFSFLRRSSTP